MSNEQKQLIREKWEKFIEKPKCKHGFTQGHYTCEPHDFPHVLGNRFGPDCETCNPPKEPTLNEIADFWLNEIDLAIKQTEERIGKEIVICSAIRMNDGYIVRGHRHADVIRTASQIPRYKNDRPFGSNQGFVTSKGRYVDRIEGAKIQKLAGIKSKMPEGQEYLHGELYSEDLY